MTTETGRNRRFFKKQLESTLDQREKAAKLSKRAERTYKNYKWKEAIEEKNLKIQAVAAVTHGDLTIREVADITGFHSTTVRLWVKELSN